MADRETNIKMRVRDLKRDIKRMRTDDGDDLPSGRYELGPNDELRRIGESTLLQRYHGTTKQSDDDVIREFKPKPDNREKLFSVRPSLSDTPAVYTTINRDDAEEYAYGASSGGLAEGEKPHLYSVVVTPDEIVDMGDCTNDRKIRESIKLGADVIECPKFWEQPETVIMDPRIIHIRNAINLQTGEELDIPPKRRAKVPEQRRLVGLPGTSPRYEYDRRLNQRKKEKAARGQWGRY